MHPRFFPNELHFWQFEGIPAYGSMLALGFLAALWVAIRLARRSGLHPDRIWDMWMGCLLAGIFGGRAWFVLQNLHEFRTEDGGFDVLGLFEMWNGGLVYYGGLLGALVFVCIYVAVTRLRPGRVLDVIAPPAALGLGFGRIGCYLNGCCWGKVCDLPWAVRFPEVAYTVGDAVRPSPAFEHHLRCGLVSRSDGWSLPVHPTQLYALAANWIVFGVLMLYFPRRRAPGQVASLFILLYAGQRFAIEFYRGDKAPLALGLTLAQLTSLGMMAVGLAVFLFLQFRSRSSSRSPAEAKP